MQAILKKIQQF